MRLHFIACGGAIMHNLAIAMKQKGHSVSGSDDKIFDPAKSRLALHDLLPTQEGFFPEKISNELDAVILGMHARQDNPELLRAMELGIPVKSFPEFIYEHAKDKKRLVVAGSHGKTSITSMIMHCLKFGGFDFDYLVGAAVKGFDAGVKLSESSTLMVIEGDEYLASPLNPIPKFLFYHPHISIISGIAWDHVNVFPTFDIYRKQFELFIESMEPDAVLFFDETDAHFPYFKNKYPERITAYSLPRHEIRNGQTILFYQNREYPLQVFGDHNLKNLEAARLACLAAGMDESGFYEAICSFEGAARRLERIAVSDNCSVFKDFAHSPSKLMATVKAVRKQFENRKLIACMELHTYSSLNKSFLSQYTHSMDEADVAVVFFNPEAAKLKRLELVTPADIREGFGRPDLMVMSNLQELMAFLQEMSWKNQNLLLMSSGDFDGLNYEAFAKDLLAES